MEIKVHKFKVLWLDDSMTALNQTKIILNSVFTEQYGVTPTFTETTSYEDFFKHYRRKKFDFIFLDINLGSDTQDGINVYRKVRTKEKSVIIVFISAYLEDPFYEDLVESLQINDENLFTLPIPLPSRRDEQYQEKVIDKVDSIKKKLEEIQSRDNERIFNLNLKEYEQLKKTEKKRILNKAFTYCRPSARKRFTEREDLKSIIIAKGKDQVILESKDILNPSFLKLYSIQEDVVPVGFKKIQINGHFDIEPFSINTFQDKLTPEIPLSTEIIHAQVLEVEEEDVLLNCLIDEEKRIFQLRKFDREPLNDEVNLSINSVITITIETYKGRRVFLFENAESGIAPLFVRKKYFDKEDEDISAFLNPKAKE